MRALAYTFARLTGLVFFLYAAWMFASNAILQTSPYLSLLVMVALSAFSLFTRS